MMRSFATLVLILTMSTFAAAQETAHESAPAEHHGASSSVGEQEPTLTTSASWVPVLMMVIGGMFVAAAAIGPIVHANAPEEVPPMHAHDEPPGSSHHHGSTGTINPSPEHPQGHENH